MATTYPSKQLTRFSWLPVALLALGLALYAVPALSLPLCLLSTAGAAHALRTRSRAPRAVLIGCIVGSLLFIALQAVAGLTIFLA